MTVAAFLCRKFNKNGDTWIMYLFIYAIKLDHAPFYPADNQQIHY
ncbi:hypothetical protein B0I21_106135 [Sphingobacterium paludis]|uniref:Uncharacterized protein n=1 Tax=Sphingobacterium paludis TaxID=1476465 RepID=A0A4V3E183_9SPHI|nr:hypothetical protein B0I21_106135 [Sphingobacterium paludis]